MSAQTELAQELVEVRGPSALSGDWRRFLSLTWLIARTDYKLTYFGSALGYVWSLMQPLLFFGVLYVVFAQVLTTTALDFPVLLLMNIVLFGFFQQGTGTAVVSLVQRESLVRKMQFPRLVVPLASVVTALITLALNLIVVMVFMIGYGVRPRWTWLLLPALLVLLFTITFGFAMILSALYVRYRDVSQIWSVVAQALYFACPVFILIESVLQHGHGIARYYLFNPLATILQQARHWMVGGSPGVPQLMGGYAWLAVPLGLIVVISVLGFWVFIREAPRAAEEL
jgi:ABC-2 type transport system permease protein